MLQRGWGGGGGGAESRGGGEDAVRKKPRTVTASQSFHQILRKEDAGQW